MIIEISGFDDKVNILGLVIETIEPPPPPRGDLFMSSFQAHLRGWGEGGLIDGGPI